MTGEPSIAERIAWFRAVQEERWSEAAEHYDEMAAAVLRTLEAHERLIAEADAARQSVVDYILAAPDGETITRAVAEYGSAEAAVEGSRETERTVLNAISDSYKRQRDAALEARARAMAVVVAARYVNDSKNWETIGLGENSHPTWQFIGDTSRLGEALAAYDAALPPPRVGEATAEDWQAECDIEHRPFAPYCHIKSSRRAK